MSKYQGYTFFLNLILILFLSVGCSQKSHEKSSEEPLSDLKAYVGQVEDPLRKDKMQGLVLSMEKNIKLFQKEKHNFVATSNALFYDYDTSRETLDKYHKDWIRARLQIQKNLIDIHFDLKETATTEEWKHIAVLQDQRFDTLAQELKDN